MINNKIWLTIDVEEIIDTNFDIKWKQDLNIDYENLIDNWIKLNKNFNYKSTCFILGSFAEKYPHLIKKLSDNGQEIASHGYNHNLVNLVSINEWEFSIKKSKDILENITNKKVLGYRSASWSLPFKREYYEILAKAGYEYSSSYFPMKTYMYGNSIDKKTPFKIHTNYGYITEYPILKNIIPFSGGLYLRVLPLVIAKYLFKNSINNNLKPIIYIHPYELLDVNLMWHFRKFTKINLDFILAFYSSSKPISKLQNILSSF